MNRNNSSQNRILQRYLTHNAHSQKTDWVKRSNLEDNATGRTAERIHRPWGKQGRTRPPASEASRKLSECRDQFWKITAVNFSDI